jgi:hypothetical protein
VAAVERLGLTVAKAIGKGRPWGYAWTSGPPIAQNAFNTPNSIRPSGRRGFNVFCGLNAVPSGVAQAGISWLDQWQTPVGFMARNATTSTDSALGGIDGLMASELGGMPSREGLSLPVLGK